MSTRADHLHVLRQGKFTVAANVAGLTTCERELLAAYGFWLEALALGRLNPISHEQRRFVAVAQGRAAPQSEHERAWVKLRPPPKPLVHSASASLTVDDEAILRELRGMLARGEVVSSFADSVLEQWEKSGRATAKQLTAVRRLVERTRTRQSVARIVGGGGRKSGSHRSNW